VEAIAAQAMVEMLEGGFTCLAEFHYLHHAPDGTPYGDPAEMAARIAAAAAQTGIGLTLLPVLYCQGGFGAQPAGAGQRRFLNTLDGFARLLDASARALAPLEGARIGAAPHSLRATTGEQITALLAMAPEGPIHIHVAEQVAEVEACLAWCGQRPVEHLLATQPVGPRWCLIHATHVSGEEAGRMAGSGAVRACARSPRPISATASFRRGIMAGPGASAPTRIWKSPRRANCGCSNTASACCIAAATCWPGPGPLHRRGHVRGCAGRRRASLRPGREAGSKLAPEPTLVVLPEGDRPGRLPSSPGPLPSR
jgi:hypothetical protein